MLLAFGGLSCTVQAQAPADDHSPAELKRQIDELYREGKFREAIPLAEKVVFLTKRAKGEEHPDTATSLNDLAELYEAVGDYTKAEPLYQKALAIRQKVLGPHSLLTGASLNNLAGLYKDTGDYPKAEPLYRKALAICRKVLGSWHPDTATCLNNLAELYRDMGDYTKAVPLCRKALAIRRKVLGPEHPDTAQSLNNLALLYQALGDYAKAEPLYQKALAIRQKVLGPEHPDTAASLDNLAGLYKDAGDYAKAEPLYQKALAIRQKVLGPDHPDTATSLNNLAGFYLAVSDYAKAEPLYQNALAIRQKVLGPDHPDTAISLNNLARLYMAVGDYAKAEPLYKHALEIWQIVLGPDHPLTANGLNNLGGVYMAMGDYAKAEPLYQRALAIRQKVLGPEHPNTATCLNNLARLYQTMGDYAKAEPLCQRALAIWQKVLGPDHPNTATSLENLAVLEFDLGRNKEAEALARRAADAQRNLLSRMFSFSSEPQRLAYFATFNPYTLFALLPACEAELAVTLLRYKGVVLDSVIEDRLIAQSSTNAEDRNRVERLNAARKQLDRLLLQAPQQLSEESQHVEELEQEVERFEGQLARHVAGLGQARRALGVTLEQVQARIPSDAALIEYLRYGRYVGKGRTEPWYGALVLLPRGYPRWIPLGDARQVDKMVKAHTALASEGRDDDELGANLKTLDEAIWAPIGAQLPDGTQRLIISPDGQLNFVSMATLLTPQGQFLAEKFRIQYLFSGRELLQEFPPTTNQNVVLFADPDFGATGATQAAQMDEHSASQAATRWRSSEKRSLQGIQFDPLPGTLQESERLLQLFARWHWPSRSQTGDQATKAALLEVRSPYILHLATHGFFEPQEPSQDAAESVDDKPSVFQSKYFANPMHQSGLAFAGANVTLRLWDQGKETTSVEDDGILTAEDVSTMDLHGTWLVTLSACDTAKGQTRAGEGVMGLRRGFAQAGAQNLVLTLWAVNDETIVQIMNDFYQAAHESGNAPEALAKVQGEWLVKLRKEKGLASAVNLAGPFIMSSRVEP
jgi:tetratricopeptide (TPR) repeat protein